MEERTEGQLSTADIADNVSSHETAGPETGNGAAATTQADDAVALLSAEESGRMRERWTEIQAAFVDEPRAAVRDADSLVAEAMKRLAEVFADERGKLEAQLDRGDEVSTEDLRVGLQRYRSFFNRLLSV
jgi:hypothetical protein